VEHQPDLSSPESEPSLAHLRYPRGWQEILEAPDAVDYQMWMDELITLTSAQLAELREPPGWAASAEATRHRWQRAIEQIAEVAIDPDDKVEMTEAEIVETALITLQANIEGIGWDEEGLAFTIPNLVTGEEAIIDLRELPYT